MPILCSNGYVPLVIFIVLCLTKFFINHNLKNNNHMEQKSISVKSEVIKLTKSVLETLWTIGTSVVAADLD